MRGMKNHSAAKEPHVKMKIMRAAVLAALLPAFVAGCSPAVPNAHAAAPVVAQAQAPAAARFAAPDFSQLAEEAGPAVVNISVTQNATAATEGPALDKTDPMYEFFKRFGFGQGGQPGGQGQRQPPRHGVGSGFIVSADGYILTNAHVVDGAKVVDVKLTDRREFIAKVIGTDPKSDVALIKIDARDLPVVKIGRAKDVKPGQWVVAMGSPFGFENSVTAGIVSAKSRSLPGDGYVPFIQTDVAVNPGNSGGPLFDMAGNVIGINSQIYSQTGGYMGLSFAIPIDVAMHVKDELQAHGKVTRGRIGVAVQNVNQSLAQSFGLKRTEGALVSSVEDGGPAAKAGIKAGDVILGWNGATVDESAALPVLVADTRPGQAAKVRVWSDGAEKTLNVTVGELPNQEKTAAAARPAANSGKLGLTLRSSEEGLVVEDATGPAAAAGVQEGDVILAVNNRPVKSVKDLRGLIDKAGKHVALLVQRDDAKVYVAIDLG
jgi:serine protease Do